MNNIKICVIGLGYVGLPIAVELSKKFSVVGYDLNEERIKELKKKKDSTNEVDLKSTNLKLRSLILLAVLVATQHLYFYL